MALLPLVMAIFGISAAFGSTKKTYHLTGKVLHDKRPSGADPGRKNFSDSALRSGSQLVGELNLTGCNGLAINELTCSGKLNLDGFGSGLDVVIRWPCEIGGSGKFSCASVGEGGITSKENERGTIRIATGEENLFKPHEHFPVTIRVGG